jgi:hypothetical protein
MISTELSMIQMLNPRRHELALLQEAFLNKGGTIEVLPGSSFVPPPVRHEPSATVGRKGKSTGTSNCKIAERMEYVSTIRELAKTMTVTEAMEATGKSESAMRRAAFEGDFRFVSKIINPEKDLRLIERLSALRDAGISRRIACLQAQISPTLICRLEQDYDFVYPKRWVKGS